MGAFICVLASHGIKQGNEKTGLAKSVSVFRHSFYDRYAPLFARDDMSTSPILF